MNRHDLQQYCLNQMGITQFVRRSLVDCAPPQNWIILDEREKAANVLNQEKQILLANILAALNWSAKMTVTTFVSWNEPTILKDNFEERLQQIKPSKVLWFEFQTANNFEFVFPSQIIVAKVPPLNTLLSDPQAKKIAWKKMQSLRVYNHT